MTFGEAVPLVGASGFATWFGQALLAWLKNKGDGAKARVDGEVSLKAQSDKLMFEILSARSGRSQRSHRVSLTFNRSSVRWPT